MDATACVSSPLSCRPWTAEGVGGPTRRPALVSYARRSARPAIARRPAYPTESRPL